jgi:hypothetical protein
MTLTTVVLALVFEMVICFNAPKEPVSWVEYWVHSGDTVCDIAISISPDDEDYRHTEYDIIKKNNLVNGMIYDGQKILIPIYD